jgi:hypothetical protein
MNIHRPPKQFSRNRVPFSITIIVVLFQFNFAHGQFAPIPGLPFSEISNTGTWNSSIVYKGADGALVYHSDEVGNRVPDFSHAGYKGGGVPLPDLPVRITLSPSSTGDDTQQINDALNEVGALEPDENGHRGAVLLNPGTYRINTAIRINHSGVVLRGSGDGEDPSQNTVIRAARGVGNVSIQIGRGNTDWSTASGSPITEIMTEFVPAGNRNFEVANASGFNVGDEIIIFHGATQEWIEAVDYGGRPLTAPNPWVRFDSGLNIVKLRRVTGISGNVIAIDTPVYNHLERSISRVLVSRAALRERISESGVEHLRLVLESDGPLANNHGNNAIVFNGVVDSWAYGVTVLHFRFQGIGVTNSSHVTIQNARALEPHSPIDGGLRYNFNLAVRATNILFTDVHATEGRHCFVSNGTASVSGIVFHNGTSKGAYNTSEGHRRWSMGLLFDKLTFSEANTSILVGLYNRGDWGTRHGWSAAHSVSWNNVVEPNRRIIIQRPPTAQNYGIGNRGQVTGVGPWEGPAGFIEGTNQIPELSSLYEAQLHDRLTYGVPPDMPVRLTVTPDIEKEALKLSWIHHSVNEIMILIERSENGGAFEEIARISSSESSFLDETIEQNIYTYRIAAIDGERMSAWSNINGFDMSLPSFDLRSPATGTTVQLSGESNRNINLWWTATSSGFPVTYTWYFDHEDGDFSEPLIEKVVDIQLVQISYGEMDDALELAGVALGSTFNGKWMVKAKAGPLVTWADEPFTLRIVRGEVITSVEQTSTEIPQALELRQNFPNPFNPETTISFGLPESGRVELVIYDLMGREVGRLVDGNLAAGWHQVRWDASQLASGTYIYRIQTAGQVQSRIMTLLK